MSLTGLKPNNFEVKDITFIAFDRQNSITNICVYTRNLLESLPGVGEREWEILAGEQEKLLDSNLLCSSSKFVTLCSDCSRSTLTVHCINSGHVEFSDNLSCQSNLLRWGNTKYISIFHSLIQHWTFTSPARLKKHLLLIFHLLLTVVVTQMYLLSILKTAFCFHKAITTSICFLQCLVRDIHQ